jgi:hypothetical protein
MAKENVVQITQSAKVKAMLAERMKEYRGHSPLQKLAVERNWCRFMLAGMDGLVHYMYKRKWLNEHTYKSLDRAIVSARYSVDNEWYARVEAMNKRPVNKRWK